MTVQARWRALRGRLCWFSIAVAVAASLALWPQLASAETVITTPEIKANTTWTAAGSPYVLEPSTVTVTSGATLTIEPGVTVELNKKEESIAGSLSVIGTIKAVGTSGNPIVFTSAAEGKGGAGVPGQWVAVTVSSGNAASEFKYADFLFGGKGTGGCYAYGALQITNGSTVPVENSYFEYNEHNGLKVNAATANVSYSTFRHNCTGLAGGGTLNVSHSEISYNTLEGSFGGDGVFFNGGAASSSFTYNTIRGNRRSGINVLEACNKPLSYYPTGEFNNIYENNPANEIGNQLTTFEKCPSLEVNWKHNYWGSAYFYNNPSQCFSTETPYKGHVAYTWAGPKHGYEAPEGPITSNQKRYGAKESEYFSCAWDSFNAEEPLSQPAPGAPPAPAELTPSELYGESSGAVPGRHNVMHCDPVNCATGNLYESATDLSVPGLNGGLTLMRGYNSQAAAAATAPGPFGYGWSFEFGQTLRVDPNSKAVTIAEANGATVTFTPAESGGYTAPPWVQAKLALNGEGVYEYTLPTQRVLFFNASGQLTKIKDRYGNTSTLAYNASGHLETVTDPSARKLTFVFNGAGMVETVTDPMGHVVKYGYSGNDLSSVTLPGEASPRWQYKYEAHQLTEITDGRGGTTTNKYEANKVIEQKDPAGRIAKWTYATNETTINEPNGSVTRMVFQGYLPVAITRAFGSGEATTKTFGYDAADNQISVSDGNGHTTKYGYDAEENLTSTTDPAGDETKWGFNKTHDVISTTTPSGETTTIEREEKTGNAKKIERPAPEGKTELTRFTYDEKGELKTKTVVLEGGAERKWEYPEYEFGQLKSEIDPEKDKRTLAYNKDGLLESSVSPRGKAKPETFTTKYERDEQGRLKKVTDPLGHATSYEYDGDGNLKTLTDANSHVTKYEYNADNEREKVEEPTKTTVETHYDAGGAVTSQVDGNGHTTKYERNKLEQVKELVDAKSRKTIKTYDLAGNLKTVKDAAERTTTFEYDPANRLTKITYSDGKTHAVEYEYDKDGNRKSMVDASGTSTLEYDQLDRLNKSTDGHGDVVSYEYDLADEPIRITYPNGKSILRGYDKAGRLKTVTDWLSHTTTFAYDADSNESKITWPSGTSETDSFTLNDADQVTKVQFKKGSEVQAQVAYTRENVGQLKSSTPKNLTGDEKQSYTYDANNRLSKAGTTSYEYDGADNVKLASSTKYEYDVADQLEKGVGTATTNYTFNQVGERTQATPLLLAPATTYGYDQAGNLTSVSRPKEGETPAIEDSYAYDGSGLRSSQTISGSTTYFTWDRVSDLPLLLNDGSNSYVYGPNGNPVEQISSSGTPLFLHHDQQGSVRVLSSASGTVEGTHSYGPYGNQIGSSGTATSPLGYDGQYTNASTGLIYLRARSYDPATAQFLSIDPLAALTRSTYGYVGESPLSGGDPSGLIFGIPGTPSWTEVGTFVEDNWRPIVSTAASVATIAGCATPGVDAGCGFYIAGNAVAQSALAATGPGSTATKLALIGANGVLAYGGFLGRAIDEMVSGLENTPPWVSPFLKGANAVPLLGMTAAQGAGSSWNWGVEGSCP